MSYAAHHEGGSNRPPPRGRRATDAQPDQNTTNRFVVPWQRQIQLGVDVLRNPRYNKGLAFTLEERRELKIEGLLPPYVITQDIQVQRVLNQYRKLGENNLRKYEFLMALSARNEKLFYRVVVENVTEMLPILYTPTVGQACLEFGHIFKTPRGMYLSINDLGRVSDILANWPERQVKAIVFTDGERILGLGDLGAYGQGIPIGKLMLYTALAGVLPKYCLPITLDVGTNNEGYLKDPMYTGLRQPRDRSERYDQFIDEFIEAAQDRWGKTVLLQFEDFGNQNAARLLAKYRDECCTFNDDIQGTAAVSVAGVLAGLPLTDHKKISDNVFLFYGAGSAGTGIANLLVYAMMTDADGDGTQKLTLEEANKRIWLVDSKGLVVKGRAGINGEKAPYAHEHRHIKDLAEIVRAVKPTCLFGVASTPQVFTEEVCREMAKVSTRPLIFALSNPTSKAECTAEQAYEWTDGKALYASGSPFPPVEYQGKTIVPGQCNNSFIFPGLALAIISTGARRVTDSMFLVAAQCLARLVPQSQLANGTLFPTLDKIRHVSATIAAAVGEEVYRLGLASFQPKPDDMLQFMISNQFDHRYDSFVIH